MYVIVAKFHAVEGSADEVARLLTEMAPLANEEPGCGTYIINRSVDDPRQFLLYEEYDDAAAFTAHTETEAFKRIILGQVVPLLDERVRETYHRIA